MNRATADKAIVLVTGATSGIGHATAALFAERGFNVIGTYRDEATVPDNVEGVRLDVTDDASVGRVVGEILTRHGRVDIVINNAGYGLFGAVEETSIVEAQRQLDVNFWGAVRVTQQLLTSMRKRRQGRIINVSSMLGLMPIPFHAFYVASKHALEGYTESLALELAPYDVKAILIEPGYVNSRFFDNSVEAERLNPAYGAERTTVLDAMRERLRRGSSPSTIAKVIHEAATVASPAPRYTAGAGAGLFKATRALLPTSAFDFVVRRSFGLAT